MRAPATVKALENELGSLTQPPVVLVGLCSHGLAILRAFARKGIPVYAIESNYEQPSAHSRYGVKLHCPSLYGPELLELLLEIGRMSVRKPLLLVTNDKMVRLLNPEQETLRQWYLLPMPRPEILSRMIDKEPLAGLALAQGLRIPRTRIVDSPDGVRDARGTITYPCIVKPAESMAAFKARLAVNESALIETIASHPEIRRFVLQSWIEGGDESVYFTNYYFGRDGKLLASFVGQKIRQYPRLLGSASAARGVDRPDLAREGLKVFDGLGFSGFGSVEFKLDRGGEPYFIETTVGRTEYLVKVALENGVDLLSVAYNDLALGSASSSCSQRNRVAWVDLDRDWEVYLECLFDPNVSKADLLRFLLAPKTLELFDLRDLRPFASWVPRFFGRVVEKAIALLSRRAPR